MYDIHDININLCSFHPLQVHVTPPSPSIIAPATVKVKDCCAKIFCGKSFQLKKSHNKSVLHREIF